MATPYNGWSSYETWLCNIHFEGWDFSEYTEQIADTEPEDEGDVRNWLEDYIRESVRDITYDPLPGLSPWVMDLLHAAFEEIDFRDIADHYSADVWEAVSYHLAQKEANS